jgi:RimJ/RimL family protein N-acetyltransferase
MRLEPFSLRGQAVLLEPLTLDHVPQLVQAATADRSTFGFTAVPDTVDGMTAMVAGLLRDAEHDLVVPFVQRRPEGSDGEPGEVLGCTRYLNIAWWAGHDVPVEVEIGGTWLRTDAQRSAVNTEAKLLLLGHAFDVWHVHRVAICTDARNERSRNAIERLGATFEGVLRNHRAQMGHLTDAGRPRDTACYSIIDSEWPDIRTRLTGRLAGSRG